MLKGTLPMGFYSSTTSSIHLSIQFRRLVFHGLWIEPNAFPMQKPARASLRPDSGPGTSRAVQARPIRHWRPCAPQSPLFLSHESVTLSNELSWSRCGCGCERIHHSRPLRRFSFLPSSSSRKSIGCFKLLRTGKANLVLAYLASQWTAECKKKKWMRSQRWWSSLVVKPPLGSSAVAPAAARSTVFPCSPLR